MIGGGTLGVLGEVALTGGGEAIPGGEGGVVVELLDVDGVASVALTGNEGGGGGDGGGVLGGGGVGEPFWHGTHGPPQSTPSSP